ncbi:hypothetical protein O6H91_09G113800 [Diphasiastrum complanatum]|uniref:Uncharacterized protein n=1 Tax=Diphasiastrum complanatum TaxID=34168 RepID=A0ACC2CTR3_DIPCM|nr:hypothetical protein O6H91_09G113800 [Diphasiastrum complanatum]
MALPDDGKVTCGLVETPVGCKSIAYAARRRRMEIRRIRIISTTDCYEEPSLKRARGRDGLISSCKDKLSLDFTFGKVESDGSCRYSVTSSKTNGVKETCATLKGANCTPLSGSEWASSSHTASSGSGVDGKPFGFRKIVDLNSRVPSDREPANFNSTAGPKGTDAASAGVVCSTDNVCAATHPQQSNGDATGVIEVSKQADEESPPRFADSSSQIPASKDIVVSSPKVSRCGCVSGDWNPSHGLVSVCGRRREMEDAVTVVPSFLQLPSALVGACSRSDSSEPEGSSDLHFYGVYDGHGGSQAAAYCKDHLHRALIRAIGDAENPGFGADNIWDSQWRRAFAASFFKIDQDIGGHNAEPVFSETVGSTAVVALVGSCQIIVANCGDSRAVLSRNGQAIPLTVDHKPDREDEMARIEAAGGRVIFWDGPRVLGVLAMSRALGGVVLLFSL